VRHSLREPLLLTKKPDKHAKLIWLILLFIGLEKRMSGMKIERVWSDYQASLRAFLHKNIANPADVDDLLQEILLKTYRNLGTVQDSKKLKSWLFQVANHTLIDFYRKRGKASELQAEDLWYQQPEQAVEEQLSLCVLPFIQSLPKEEATLLKAIEIDGISQKLYAEQTGVKYSTLKSQVQKSRKMLLAVFRQCCDFSVDHQGNISDFEPKRKRCTSC